MPDLGIIEKESAMTVPPDASSEPHYPSLSLKDENIKAVKGDKQCELGEEYTATVRLRVKALSDDTYGSRLEFDVLSMDDFAPADGAAEYGAADDTQDDAGDTGAQAPPPDAAKGGKKSSKALTYS